MQFRAARGGKENPSICAFEMKRRDRYDEMAPADGYAPPRSDSESDALLLRQTGIKLFEIIVNLSMAVGTYEKTFSTLD